MYIFSIFATTTTKIVTDNTICNKLQISDCFFSFSDYLLLSSKIFTAITVIFYLLIVLSLHLIIKLKIFEHSKSMAINGLYLVLCLIYIWFIIYAAYITIRYLLSVFFLMLSTTSNHFSKNFNIFYTIMNPVSAFFYSVFTIIILVNISNQKQTLYYITILCWIIGVFGSMLYVLGYELFAVGCVIYLFIIPFTGGDHILGFFEKTIKTILSPILEYKKTVIVISIILLSLSLYTMLSVPDFPFFQNTEED